jgi:hypothetical protein
LQRRVTYMVANHQTTNTFSHLKFDLIPINIAAHFYWIVPKGQRVPFWRTFLSGFDPIIWFLILFFLIFLTSIWHFMERKSVSYSFLLHYQLLFESGNLEIVNVQKLSTRILTGTSMVAFLIISSTFKSKMLSALTRNDYEYLIDSLDDIIRDNLSCYVAKDMKLLYEAVDELYSRYVSKCHLIDEHDDQQDILLTIALEQNVATISRFLKIKFAANRLLEMGYDDRPMHLIRRQVKFDFLYLYLAKGFPLYDRILETAARMYSAGFSSYFRTKVDYKIDKALKVNEKIGSNTLVFEQISIAFYVFLAGLALSCVVFFWEVATNRKK